METAVFDASFGHSTGISVNQKTRSGVNDPHGSANWQYWNNRWNAANMFQRQNYYTAINAANAAGNSALAQQLASSSIQAAGFSKSVDLTFGGPVYIPKLINGRNKLFFFFNFGWNNELRIGPNGSGNYYGSDAGEPDRRFLEPAPGGAAIYDFRSSNRPAGPGAAGALHPDAVLRQYRSHQQNYQPDVQRIPEITPAAEHGDTVGSGTFQQPSHARRPGPHHQFDMVQSL